MWHVLQHQHDPAFGVHQYSYDGFAWGPEHRSDACGSCEFLGGGYIGQDGFYDYYVWLLGAGRRTVAQCEARIDLLEAKVNEQAAQLEQLNILVNHVRTLEAKVAALSAAA